MISASQVYSPRSPLSSSGPAREIHLVDVVHHDLGVEALGVLAHALHQPRAGEAVRVARPVVDLGGGHQLAALFHAGEQQRLAIGARGVDGGGIAGGTGAEDDQPGVTGTAHVYFLALLAHRVRGGARHGKQQAAGRQSAGRRAVTGRVAPGPWHYRSGAGNLRNFIGLRESLELSGDGEWLGPNRSAKPRPRRPSWRGACARARCGSSGRWR